MTSNLRLTMSILIGIGVIVSPAVYFCFSNAASTQPSAAAPSKIAAPPGIAATSKIAAPSEIYDKRFFIDTAGFMRISMTVPGYASDATLEEIGNAWRDVAKNNIEAADRTLASNPNMSAKDACKFMWAKATMLNYEGETKKAYQLLEQIRSRIQADANLKRNTLYTLIYYQGITALRRGENDNCIMCRGESSCIIPIASAAIHTNPEGSRLAIHHFTEYLDRFPDDLEVIWLLNVAHMTLGEYPDKVDARYRLSLDNYFRKTEFDIGKFRDIGHLVGVNQLTQSGGSIMEDFDNDGLLDIVITSFDPTCQMNLLRNTGDGHFEDLTEKAGLTGQLGGLNCVQTDYNNDGCMDIFVVRGAWVARPMRPTLLRGDGHGVFTDVTEEAGLLDPVNSISATWADYDNDGWLDLFICCELQNNRLYHNLGNGAFEEVALKAGLPAEMVNTKGAAWIDYDNDNYPDLFQNHLSKDSAQLFHNNRDGTFTEVTQSQGINGPIRGFSCWAWDYDNDGWQDIFATCFEKTLKDVVKGMLGQPHSQPTNRLFHNRQGNGFDDVTEQAGLDMVFSTMGSNFGDFDNDGFLDMYLGTGDPDIATLVPNRMFRNVAGKRFAEITASSGTGNLQKGHGVACGDWDRDGNVDIFIEMGGAVNGDKYHNILFQNPGHDNHWLTVKLVGEKTNRAAIGARIKVVTAGAQPQTFYRHVSSGSSFGANPLEQTIGLSKAERIAVLEITWPTSGTTQVFHDLEVNQAIKVTEFADTYETLDYKRIPVPK